MHESDRSRHCWLASGVRKIPGDFKRRERDVVGELAVERIVHLRLQGRNKACGAVQLERREDGLSGRDAPL